MDFGFFSADLRGEIEVDVEGAAASGVVATAAGLADLALKDTPFLAWEEAEDPEILVALGMVVMSRKRVAGSVVLDWLEGRD